MNGKEVWLKVFNTDFEEAVLNYLDMEKDFEDEGTDEQNEDIVKRLEGWTYEKLFDIYLNYHGHGLDFSTLKDMFEMLQIDEDWNKAKEGFEEF